MTKVKPADLVNHIGSETGTSDWYYIDQQRINDFADVTEDHQFIHVDAEKAKASRFGTTIAHGFLSLSLLSHLCEKAFLSVEGTKAGLNYGFDKVRFMTPVKVGSHIRAVAKLGAVTDKGAGRVLLSYDITVEIKGEERPAYVAQWLVMVLY